jgi:DNA-binding transcriptional MerR regulator
MIKTKDRTSATSFANQSFTSSEISDCTGVSLRQLQWWDEQKVVSPRHEGHKRIYQAEEAIEIAVIAELRRKGFSLQKIRLVLRFLQKEMAKRITEITKADQEWHLVTDGKNISMERDSDKIIDIIKSADQPMFLVSVTDQVTRLGSVLAPRKPVRGEAAPARTKQRVG